MGLLGFVAGSLIPHIAGTHGLASTGAYLVHTALPFVVAHPLVGIPVVLVGGTLAVGSAVAATVL